MLNQCRQLKDTVIGRLNPSLKNIFIHLKEVDFIDSAGLGLLVGIKMSANKYNAQTYLVAPKNEVKTLFSVAKLDMIFKILKTEDEMPDKSLLKKAHAKLEDETATFDTKKSAAITEQTTDNNKRASQKKSTSSVQDLSIEERKKRKKEMICSYCREALNYLNEGKLYKAIQNFKNALREDPTYLPARNNLALLYEKKQQWYEQALEEWETLLTVAKEMGEDKYQQRAQKHIEKLHKMLKK